MKPLKIALIANKSPNENCIDFANTQIKCSSLISSNIYQSYLEKENLFISKYQHLNNTNYKLSLFGLDDKYEEFDSEETINALANEIRSFGHNVEILEANSFLPQILLNNKFDFIFNIAEGFHNRNRESLVPALCELLQIPYSGSDPTTMGLTLDKHLAKIVVSSYNVPTARGKFITTCDNIDFSDLNFPIIIKPAFEGSSKGIRNSSKVNNEDEAKKIIEFIFSNYKNKVLIEEFLDGPECTVGIIGNENPEIIGIMEIAPKQIKLENFIYSLETKRDYLNQVEYYVPPRFDIQTIKKIEKFAIDAYKALECRDYARIDFRLDSNNNPYFLEANPLPGLSPYKSDLVILAYKNNISYHQLIEKILTTALTRVGLL